MVMFKSNYCKISRR